MEREGGAEFNPPVPTLRFKWTDARCRDVRILAASKDWRTHWVHQPSPCLLQSILLSQLAEQVHSSDLWPIENLSVAFNIAHQFQLVDHALAFVISLQVWTTSQYSSQETLPLSHCLYSDRMSRNAFKLKKGRFKLDVQMKFFIQKMVRHWNRLPNETVSLEAFKATLDGTLSSLI